MRAHRCTLDCGLRPCPVRPWSLASKQMPVPKHTFDPPFNIVRSSHIALGVADLGRSRAFYARLGLHQRGRRPQHPHPARQRGEAASVCPCAAPTAQPVGFAVASKAHLDNKAARYFPDTSKRAEVSPRSSSADPARSRPATAVGRAGAGVERRLALFAKVLVAGQDRTARKPPAGFTQAAGAERQHRIDR
jgi:catechol 2,3-dioxygenase-like lactoylglutathione lyase family enzyme